MAINLGLPVNLPLIVTSFYILECEIEKRVEYINSIKQQDESIGILADRNILTISYPQGISLDLENVPLKEVKLGSPEYLYYYSTARRHVLYLSPATEEIGQKIKLILNAQNVTILDENRIRVTMFDLITENGLVRRLTEHLSINDKHEFTDGKKKYVLKSV